MAIPLSQQMTVQRHYSMSPTAWCPPRRRSGRATILYCPASRFITYMRVAIVTGGTRGIGKAISSCLGRDGYDLILGFNANTDKAAETKAQLEKQHAVRVHTVQGDVALQSTLDAYFDQVREHFDGEVTAFIHNAALAVGFTTPRTDAQPTDTEDVEQMYQYYNRVYPLCLRRGIDGALACRGLKHVVALSDPGCNTTMSPRIANELSATGKSAMEYLVRCYALKLAKDGINVNAVVPGYTRTDFYDIIPPEWREKSEVRVKTQTPSRRWGTVEEVGEAVAFLCSPKGGFVTGISMPVDGGLHLIGGDH